MAKLFFRWLRGELNGFYITNMYMTLNERAKETKDFLYSFGRQQFAQGKIENKNLYGLGKFAGIFLPRLKEEDVKGSIRFTESHVVNGTEYSERGLLNTETEAFEFKHTQGETTPDINTLATDTLRSSLVGDEAVQGYIAASETEVLDENGKVKPEKVLQTAPSNEAYSDFYGNKFLFLSEGDIVYSDLEPSLYLELFKALQWVRYNGDSIKALAKIVSLICPSGLVKLGNLTASNAGKHYYIYYDYDSSADVDNKRQRMFLLNYIVNIKFPRVTLVENI